MSIKTITTTLIVAISLTLVARYAAAETTAANLNDHQIAEVMKTANDLEIDAGKVARTRATIPQVKDFAEEMISTHKQNEKDAKDLTKRVDIKPKSNDVAKDLKKEVKTNLSDVKKMKGTDFDKAYIKMQITMHQNLLNDLDQKFIPAAQNIHYKEFLQKTREHVAAHLTKAHEIETAITK